MLKELLALLEGQDDLSARAERILKHLCDLHIVELLNGGRPGKLTAPETLEELLMLASTDERNLLELEKRSALVNWVKSYTKFPTPAKPVGEESHWLYGKAPRKGTTAYEVWKSKVKQSNEKDGKFKIKDDMIGTAKRVMDMDEAIDTSPKPFRGDYKWTADDAIRLQNSLGERVEFHSFKAWSKALNDLPHAWKFNQEQIPWIAVSRTKTMEGVAGKWDPRYQKGWIYEHYLNPDSY